VAYTSEHPIVHVTVDVVALTISDGALCALAIRRGRPPFQGSWALPGGFVEPDEDLEQAARRELAEETSVPTGGMWLEQLRTYGTPGRDPRHRTVTVAWLGILPQAPVPVAASDAAHAEWRPVDRLSGGDQLAFDHHEILADGVERARNRLEYTNLATAFVEPEFTVTDLREVYQVVWGTELDPGNFHRKVRGTRGFLEPTGGRRASTRGRPAELFRAGPEELLTPPLTRVSLR